MPRPRALPVYLLFGCCLGVFFLNLGAARLFDEDEPKNAECAREMYERGDAVVPTFNYDLRTDKPIMLYWLMLASIHCFGVSEFAVRLPSALAATCTVLLLYHVGTRLFDRRVGFWGAVILASSMMFVTVARASTPDSTLIAFTTLAMFLFVRGTSWRPETADASGTEGDWPASLISGGPLALTAMYAAMGLAVLTKGPVGFLLPCAAIGLYLLLMADRPEPSHPLNWRRPFRSLKLVAIQITCVFAPKSFWRALRAMHPLILTITVCAIALPWYIAVGLKTDGAWLAGFLGQHNFGRFTSAMEGHWGSPLYYLPVILIGFFPWSVVLPVCLLESWRSRRSTDGDRRGVTFLLSWTMVYVVFFSIAQTKLPNYVLPCYPALALLTARTLVRWNEGAVAAPKWTVNWALGSLIAAGTALVVGPIVLSHLLLDGYAALGLIGVVPIVIGVTAFRLARTGRRDLILRTLGAGSLAFVILAFGVMVPWISRAQESPQLGRAAADLTGANGKIATFGYFAPNLPFYARQQIEQLRKPRQIKKFFAGPNAAALCVKASQYSQVADLLGDDVDVVVTHRRRRFLRNEDILILSRPASTNTHGPVAITNRKSKSPPPGRRSKYKLLQIESDSAPPNPARAQNRRLR